jgi:hypothetical protein
VKVYFANASIGEQAAFLSNSSTMNQFRTEYELRNSTLQADIDRLQEELKSMTIREQRALEERDDKTRRIAELHLKLLEFEKTIAEQRAALQEFEKFQQAGFGEKIKGIFKK